ncbi:PHB depolymerase family esterase [Yersinia sp. Marseille-Q3913]|uniref:PHB depolymerase family esterase n=1 Tax=Yersinia sp. Marseille-Q3913 TaxID=2830769 RepID=UPI001BAF89C0|nr:PHB depolymerase family esterase [Yersinia sp. Marseille-Q3913]MBS0057666.1 hypothetical protein [Yersinia sp. Marseille-Q3913]
MKLLLSIYLIVLFTINSYAGDVIFNLPKLHIDNERIGITGISSGAYMAIQAQLSVPYAFKKAGILAGGPYACAEGLNLEIEDGYQLFKCMNDMLDTEPYFISAKRHMTPTNISHWALRATARGKYEYNTPGYSDLDNLQGGVVYFLHGVDDKVVIPEVANAAVEVYKQIRSINFMNGKLIEDKPVKIEIINDGNRDFQHTFPTRASRTSACDKSESPFIAACGIDAAGLIFENLYKKSIFPVNKDDIDYTTEFYQASIDANLAQGSLAERGYAYIPKLCASGTKCGVLIALHGCNQNAERPDIGTQFVNKTGFNRWADAYNVIMLYPQIHTTEKNPSSCWDWMGYTGKNFAQSDATQIEFFISMLKAIGYVPPKL